MPVNGIHHITLAVADVARSEAAYCDAFDLDVLFREGTYDGEFGALPDGLDWSTATDVGVEPGMTFLGDGDVAIAVAERDDHDPDSTDDGTLDHVALDVDEEDVHDMAMAARAHDWDVDERESTAFVVDDDGIEWELTASDPPPATPFDELDVG